ncbi:MAG: nucleoside triphosphate pyrophosphohydrolase [Gemmatimonadota bacterium]|nr:nucleoside triphosphate pyrophosphohydrolase [Gemmatimonadota bacterium]
MQESSAVGRIVDLVRDLRARCPWDQAQTPQTLRPYLMEEVFELDHALGEDDADAIRVELGDLLLHLAFQIVLAEEREQFGPEDLTRQVEAKMWRRHPHLFPVASTPTGRGAEGQRGSAAEAAEAAGPPAVTASPPDRLTADAVKANWEKLKLRERGHEAAPSVLDGLPPGMPALIMAFRMQERAAGIGFDWPDWRGPLEKIREESQELAAELTDQPDTERVAHEVGDLLFAVVNLARKVSLDPRAALEGANRRFARRFGGVEQLARARGVDVHTAGLEELDRLWEEVKRGEERAS